MAETLEQRVVTVGREPGAGAGGAVGLVEAVRERGASERECGGGGATEAEVGTEPDGLPLQVVERDVEGALPVARPERRIGQERHGGISHGRVAAHDPLHRRHRGARVRCDVALVDGLHAEPAGARQLRAQLVRAQDVRHRLLVAAQPLVVEREQEMREGQVRLDADRLEQRRRAPALIPEPGRRDVAGHRAQGLDVARRDRRQRRAAADARPRLAQPAAQLAGNRGDRVGQLLEGRGRARADQLAAARRIQHGSDDDVLVAERQHASREHAGCALALGQVAGEVRIDAGLGRQTHSLEHVLEAAPAHRADAADDAGVAGRLEVAHEQGLDRERQGRIGRRALEIGYQQPVRGVDCAGGAAARLDREPRAQDADLHQHPGADQQRGPRHGRRAHAAPESPPGGPG